MTTIDFNKFKCRCSKIHTMFAVSAENRPLTPKQQEDLKQLQSKTTLTEKQLLELNKLLFKRDAPKDIEFSQGAIDYLLEWYAWEAYKKMPVDKESLGMLQTEKGKKVEIESIFLLSKHDGVIYEKNEQRIENEYLSGEPDVYTGEHIMQAESVTDMKNSWDYPTFLKQIQKSLERPYIFQIKGYGNITGAKDLSITRMIVNTPLEIIKDYMDKVARKMGVIDTDTPSFQEEWQFWENSMTFDEIPLHMRVHKTKVEPFTEEECTFLYDRVKQAREWLFNFHEEYTKMNR